MLGSVGIAAASVRDRAEALHSYATIYLEEELDGEGLDKGLGDLQLWVGIELLEAAQVSRFG
jgi:hypothetical protein